MTANATGEVASDGEPFSDGASTPRIREENRERSAGCTVDTMSQNVTVTDDDVGKRVVTASGTTVGYLAVDSLRPDTGFVRRVTDDEVRLGT